MRLLISVFVFLFSTSPLWADSKAGKRVYMSKCKSCHAKDGKGANAKIAKGLKIDHEKLSLEPMAKKTDEESLEIIRSGKDDMPGYGEKLSAEQIQSLLEYCRTLIPREGVETSADTSSSKQAAE